MDAVSARRVELIGKIVRIAGGKDSVERCPAGRAMIGVQLVTPPWIPGQHAVGVDFANQPRQFDHQIGRAKRAIGIPEEHHTRNAQFSRRGALFTLPRQSSRGDTAALTFPFSPFVQTT